MTIRPYLKSDKKRKREDENCRHLPTGLKEPYPNKVILCHATISCLSNDIKNTLWDEKGVFLAYDEEPYVVYIGQIACRTSFPFSDL